MDPKKNGRGQEASQLPREKMNETARQIRAQLNLSDIPMNETPDFTWFNKIKTNIKKIEIPAASVIWVPILIGIITYLICCFSLCEENDCCGPILLTFPLLISKKALCWCILQTINLLKKVPCEDDTKLISSPPVKEKITELAKVFQEEETKNDLLVFWIPLLVLAAWFGILLIGGIITGLVRWMINRARNNQTLLGINDEGSWVYGSKLQQKAALTADEGKNVPVEETK